MAVLVAVLYAFSRLASENEITAMKAGGVSSRSLLRPSLAAATVLAIFMLWFNDQLLSRANHELATLQIAILRTKPTFALKPQVINAVKESQLYLRADQISQDESGRMRGVTIYDVSEPARRRSIYADSGTLVFAANKKDLVLHLYRGMMMTAPSQQHGQLERIYYNQDELKVRDVANSFQSINADTASKGEREMTVCEMQMELELRHLAFQRAYHDSVMAAWRFATSKGKKLPEPPKQTTLEHAGGIGALYCKFITKYLKVPAAQAAELPARLKQDTTKKAAPTQKKSDSVWALIGSVMKKVPRDKVPPGAFLPETSKARAAGPAPNAAAPAPVVVPRPVIPAPATTVAPPPGAAPAPSSGLTATPPPPGDAASINIELSDAKVRLDDARHWQNRYGVEIQKKFSLAFACIVFVLVGAPIALRFPRGGVGLVIGVSFVVFAIYYIGLIGGESLANHNIISPFWAMWADNVIFLLVGLLLVSRMGREGVTTRGGNLAETMDKISGWFTRTRATPR